MKLKTKRNILMALIVFSLMLCIGSVSASDDAVLADSSDTLVLGDSNANILEDSNEEILEDADVAPISTQEDETATAEIQETESDIDDGKLSTEISQEDETLSASPDYDEYSVWVTTFTYGFSNKLVIYVDAQLNGYNTYAYDFYVRILDSSGNQLFNVNEYNSTDLYGTITYTFNGTAFAPGTYTVNLVNYYDDVLMDSATLHVINAAGILSAGNYAALYNSGTTFNVKLTESGTNRAIPNALVKLVFKKGSKTYTRTAYTDSSGYVKINPNIPVGTYSVQISVAGTGVSASPITKTATVKKTGIKLKISKIKTYQGIKFNLKATVKSSSGKKVNEGYVLFKIKGKKYKVPVKNGVAKKKIKISKVSKGKYTAKYLANSNYKSKKATNKFAIKKRYATKVTTKSYSGYGGTTKTLTAIVKTKSGKKVKSGYVLFTSSGGFADYAKVKNGKAKIRYSFYNYYYYYYYTYYYSKKTKFTLKAKYYPTTYKYKGSSSKFKVTHKYRCIYCGKKKSHYHGFYEMKVV